MGKDILYGWIENDFIVRLGEKRVAWRSEIVEFPVSLNSEYRPDAIVRSSL